MASEEAESHKEKGNAAFKERNWDEAVKHYNKAICLDPNNAAYYSNRSGAWSSKGSHESALRDAEKCLEIDPNFVKGYSRKGKALFDMQRWDEAEAAYEEGLDKDPNNSGCKQGVADVGAAKRARDAASRSNASGGGLGNIFGGGLAGLVPSVMKRLKRGGRMQMYMVVLVAYYGYQHFMKPDKSSSSDKPIVETESAAEDDEEEEAVELKATAPAGTGVGDLGRHFLEGDGSWLSFVRTESSKKSPLLLLLHRTSLSTEADYGPALSRLSKAGPPGGLNVLAPDRPCHGYSPCPAGGEPKNATAWLEKLLAASPSVPKSIAVVATGREASAQALSLARAKRQVEQVWLLSPHASVPKRGARAPRTVAELAEWMQGHRPASTAAAAADAAGWVLRVDRSEEELRRPPVLNGVGVPKSCQVTILSDDEQQQQDEELTNALEENGLTVNTLSFGGKGVLDVLVEDVDSVLGAPAGTMDKGE